MRRMQGVKKLSQGVVAAALMMPCALLAQARGQWHLTGNDQAHDNWQQTEWRLTPELIKSGQFQLLWKVKLGSGAPGREFTEFLFTPSMISSRGFKDIGLVGDEKTVYALDYSLGQIFWQHDFDVKRSGTCKPAPMEILMEPGHVIRFAASKPKAQPAAPTQPPPPPPAPADRWIGAPSPGGGFGIKGIYVLTGDGMLHEQNMTNGKDYAPPVQMLPKGTNAIAALNMNDKVLFAVTHAGCSANTELSSIDLNSVALKKESAAIGSGAVIANGPAIGADGTVFISANEKNARVLDAVDATTLKVKGAWSFAEKSAGESLNVGPMVLGSGESEFVAAAGKDGSLALLNAEALASGSAGGPIAQTATIAKSTKATAWESLSSWTDKSGMVWLLASIDGAVDSGAGFTTTNGNAPQGSIIAFKLTKTDTGAKLEPAWVSRDLLHPSQAVIANGIVYVLSGGDATHHAVLYALDASTGVEMYSSGAAIESYAVHAKLSVGDGHVFFTTHDNTLYSFGFPMEH